MKSLKTLLVFFLAAVLGMGIISCGDDDTIPASVPTPTPTPDPTPDGEIDAEVFVINKNEILMGVNTLENGWYSYVLQFGFGVKGADAYNKGMTQMRLTAWADNGCLDTPYSTSNYGKKKTYTLYLSSTNRERYEWIYVSSKDSRITFNYKLEYYNSNNGKWYDIQSKKLTFYKK